MSCAVSNRTHDILMSDHNLAALLRQTGTAEIDCPRSMVGRVIGKGGETIKALQQYTGAMIQIDQSVEPTKVTIAGSPKSLQLAVSMVSDIVKGNFKGFAMLRQMSSGTGPQLPRGYEHLGQPQPVYVEGYGFVPPSQSPSATSTAGLPSRGTFGSTPFAQPLSFSDPGTLPFTAGLGIPQSSSNSALFSQQLQSLLADTAQLNPPKSAPLANSRITSLLEEIDALKGADRSNGGALQQISSGSASPDSARTSLQSSLAGINIPNFTSPALTSGFNTSTPYGTNSAVSSMTSILGSYGGGSPRPGSAAELSPTTASSSRNMTQSPLHSLPAGFVQVTDPEGRVFYYNQLTGQACWNRPT